MSAFKVTLNVAAASLGVPSDEALKAGQPPAVEVNLTIAQQLPFGEAGQPPIMAHLGDVTYSLGRDTAIEFFKKGLEAAEALPPESKLQLATDVAAAEAAAEKVNQFRADAA